MIADVDDAGAEYEQLCERLGVVQAFGGVLEDVLPILHQG